MKKYRTVITKQAQTDLRSKLAYIRDHLRNLQAVKSVYDDYKLTRKALEEVADTIREPESDKLRERALKRINFRTHNYFMLFRIRDNRVEILLPQQILELIRYQNSRGLRQKSLT